MGVDRIMKEKPILFNGEMVRAILEGRKTQTRRVMEVQPVHEDGGYWWPNRKDWKVSWAAEDSTAADLPNFKVEPATEWFLENNKCRYGKPGDQLWIRETCWIAKKRFSHDDDNNCVDPDGDGRQVGYDASMSGEGRSVAKDYGVSKYPSIHMPRWASRIQLEIVNVRVERVQDISHDDALAEGVIPYTKNTMKLVSDKNASPACLAFEALWDSINAAKGMGWEANPFVWVIEFRKL